MNKYPVPLGGKLEVSYLLLLPVDTRQKLNSSTVIPAPSLFEPRLGDEYWEPLCWKEAFTSSTEMRIQIINPTYCL